jgi:phage-related protein
MPFIRDVVVPWLQEKIPAALQTLSDFWNKTLLPAITDVWNFINTYIVPIFKTLVEVGILLLKLAIAELAALWKDPLLPAITTIRDFIRDHLLPIFTSIRDFIRDEVGPKLQWLNDTIIAPLASAISSLVTGALQWLLDKLTIFRDMLAGIHLPDWLTPGSATPFELGIRGIGEAIAELNRVSMPQLAASFGISAGGGVVHNYGPTTTIHLHANYAYQSETDLISDVRMLAMLAR